MVFANNKSYKSTIKNYKNIKEIKEKFKIDQGKIDDEWQTILQDIETKIKTEETKWEQSAVNQKQNSCDAWQIAKGVLDPTQGAGIAKCCYPRNSLSDAETFP